LIGLQHLDFNDQGTQEEIRKINSTYANAISHDVADRGNALAEKTTLLTAFPLHVLSQRCSSCRRCRRLSHPCAD
jgi:hypothetical protein